VVSNVGSDPTTVGKSLGAAAPLLEGVVAANYLPLATDDANPWIQLYKKVNSQYNGNAEFDNNIIYGMSVGYLFVQTLQAAGKDLTRDNLIAAVEKGGFTGPGMVPLRLSAKDHSGYSGEQLTKITGGKAVYFGTPYQTDDGDGAVAAYTGPRPAPAAERDPAGASSKSAGRKLRVAATSEGAAMADQVAIVTGASRGIGFAIAQRFVAEGSKVCITGATPRRSARPRKDLGGPEVAIGVAGKGDDADHRAAVIDTVLGSSGRSPRWSTTSGSTRRTGRSARSTWAPPARCST
jgi:hypothetical protein